MALHDDAKATASCCRRHPCTRHVPGFARWRLPDGSVSEICPVMMVTPISEELVRWHTRYRRGVLPLSGGWYDQTALFCEAMDALDEVRA